MSTNSTYIFSLASKFLTNKEVKVIMLYNDVLNEKNTDYERFSKTRDCLEGIVEELYDENDGDSIIIEINKSRERPYRKDLFGKMSVLLIKGIIPKKYNGISHYIRDKGNSTKHFNTDNQKRDFYLESIDYLKIIVKWYFKNKYKKLNEEDFNILITNNYIKQEISQNNEIQHVQIEDISFQEKIKSLWLVILIAFLLGAGLSYLISINAKHTDIQVEASQSKNNLNLVDSLNKTIIILVDSLNQVNNEKVNQQNKSGNNYSSGRDMKINEK